MRSRDRIRARPRLQGGPLRGLRLPGVLLACMLFGGVAQANARAPSASDDAPAESIGRFCTPYGCSGSLESALGNAAGFGAAALAVVLLARRRSA